ncbi:hypothetical protein CU098_002735, partial [Rhizopus stolonifer]
TASDDDHSPVITLWDLRYAHTPQRTLRGHTQGVLDLSWCRQDADRLFSSGKDGNTLCWNPNTGELQGPIATETQPTFQVAWSYAHPDLLATSSLDGSVYVYSLFQPSSWLRRPIGASFGSNGTLVTFNATKKTVQLKAMTAHSDIIQRSQQLVSATEEQLASLIKKRIQQGQDQQDWQVLDILFSHHAREAMIHYLGFQKEQIAAKATHLLTTKDVDTLITQAIMLGDFESAVDACLASKRFSDAFAIASCSSNALLDRTRKAYFEANQVGYMCLLESIAHDDLVSMVHQADLSQWSCILATLCTFASAQEFGALCDQMGQRLSDHAELCSHATLFYLVSGNLPKLVQAWTQTIDRHNPSSLQSVIEKITVFQKAIDFKDRGEKDAEGRYVLADLYDLYQDYAAWMTAQGQSDIALTYQQLIPSLGEKTSAVAPTTPAKKTTFFSLLSIYLSIYMPRVCKSGTVDVVDQLKVLEPTHRFKSKRQSLHQRRHTIDAWHHLDEPLLPCRRLSDCPSPKKKSVQSPHKRILVTGGAGYIGSHTCLELLNAGYDIVVMDNLINANKEALHRVEQLAGRPIVFMKGNVTHESDLEDIFQHYQFWAVIHFAAIKAVGESTRIPLDYYHNNLTGTLNLLRVMKRHNLKQLVFSSSATVYGEPEMMPVNETARLGPVTNPYGRTKLFAEQILHDLYLSDPEWNVILLRFFNPVGAHNSGMIGEHPHGVPNNLLPYVVKVLQGHLPFVHVFGNNYDTVDGTGVRDYIHVCDLATGHLAALNKLEEKPGCKAYNLGTGAGYSVLEIIQAMERATHKKIPYKIEQRRPGDVGTCTADASLANQELGWHPIYSMDDMCQDMWRWTQRNPNGYDGELL